MTLYNRPHAVAYSLLSYQTARLKCLYPLEFFAALLHTVDEKDKRARYLRNIVRRGYKILPPDINYSEAKAMPVYDPPGIRFGLQDYAGIGKARVKRLLNARPLAGYREPHQVASIVDAQTYNILCEGGALRAIGVPGRVARASQLLGWHFADRTAKYRDEWERLLNEPDDEEGPCQVIGELVTVRKNKSKASGKPYVTWVVRWDPATEWTLKLWSDTHKYWHVPVGAYVRVQGDWQPEWSNVSVSARNSVWVWHRGRWKRANEWQPKEPQTAKS